MQHIDFSFSEAQTRDFCLLYCETDSHIATSTIEILRRFFDRIDVALTHGDAISLFNASPVKYDLVIARCDKNLEMAKHIKHTKKDVTLLLTSDEANVADFILMIDLGVDGFIPQPYSGDEFLNSLSKVIQVLLRKKDFQNDLDALIEYKEAAEMVMDELIERIKH